MNRFEQRMNQAARRAMTQYQTSDVVFKTTDGRLLTIVAVLRPPNSVQVDNSPGRNVFFAFEWLVTGETLKAMKTFAGYANALFCGETLIHDSGVYRLDRLTPYSGADGTASLYRLLTTKEGETGNDTA